MLHLCIYHLIFSIILVNSFQIPYINNATLKPGYTSNSTLLVNVTYDQCLCQSSLSYPAVNWFPNNTCQLFLIFPPTYRIEMTTGARLYFPHPHISECQSMLYAGHQLFIEQTKTGQFNFRKCIESS